MWGALGPTLSSSQCSSCSSFSPHFMRKANPSKPEALPHPPSQPLARWLWWLLELCFSHRSLLGSTHWAPSSGLIKWENL